ncbi:hypothetical protein SJI19_10595 [Acerihabitans sp. TG2]|uniref:hypothetical protein n=1 Tax=Acerihabitans sp. TG2 TaxID=3096008 RepID=UPI002B22A48D|nr:hypothetical protein [Acerihabitans sp. TG2]MEA9390988.1 hypothetical protein [Acerihabitans sp. TG2]
MKRTAIFTASLLLQLAVFHVSANEKNGPLFYCTTDDGDTVSVVENGDKLELKVNNDSYLSNESIKQLKLDYIKQTNKDSEYKVINFHSKTTEIYVGTSRGTPTQDLPNSNASISEKNDRKTTYYPCTLGDEENNFDLWKKRG